MKFLWKHHCGEAFVGLVIRQSLAVGCGLFALLATGYAKPAVTKTPTLAMRTRCIAPLGLELARPYTPTALRQTQTDCYAVKLAAGEFMRVIVEQQAIDVVLSLARENAVDTPLVQVDRPSGEYGSESLAWIAERAGTYLIQVQPLGKLRFSALRRYTINLLEKRMPQAGDAERIRAEKLMTDGETLRSTGKAAEALAQFTAAYQLWAHPLRDAYEQYVALYAQGLCQQSLGDYQAAADAFQQSLQVLPPQHSTHWEAVSRTGRGWAFFCWGEYLQALENYEIAAQHRLANDWRGQGITALGLGLTHAKLGHQREALQFAHKSLDFRKRMNDEKLLAIAYSELGNLQLEYGQHKRALASYRASLSLLARVGDRQLRANALSGLGELYRLNKNYRAARRVQQETLLIAQAFGDRVGQARTLYRLGKIEREQGQLAVADDDLTRSVKIINELLEQGDDPWSQALYFRSIREVYEYFAALLMERHAREPKAGFGVRALQVSEKLHAWELSELLTDAGCDLQPSLARKHVEINKALVQQRVDFRRQIHAHTNQIRNLLDPQFDTACSVAATQPEEERRKQLAHLMQERKDLLREYRGVLQRIRVKDPEYAAWYPTGHEETEIKRLLDADTLLLEYAVLPQQTLLWAITVNRIHSFVLPASSVAIRDAAAALTPLTNQESGNTRTFEQAAARLSGLLFPAQVAKLMAGKQRLVIIPDAVFYQTPLNALTLAGARKSYRPLAADYEVVKLPSLAKLRMLREMKILQAATSPPTERRRVAIFADPVSETDSSGKLRGLWRLPGTLAEAAVIKTLAPHADEFIGAAANANLFKQDRLANYYVIHIATHAATLPDHQEGPVLILSPRDEQGRAQKSEVGLSDLFRLQLQADLVVLSACETGTGRDWFSGLSGVFMHAGAARVVASLWPVPDSATAHLMKEFYQGVFKENLAPAAALSKAQRLMWEQQKWTPYEWAGFCFSGDWQGLSVQHL